MALFNKKKPQENKAAESDEKITTTGKVNEHIININKYGYNKNEIGRIVQLTAFFHMLKLDLGKDCYSEMITKKDETLYIPYSFNIYEEIALAKKNMTKSWYLELDANNYVEISFDEVKINGTPAFFKIAHKAFEQGEAFTTDLQIYQEDFSTGADWQWNQFKKMQYQKCIAIGDHIFKNGSLTLYPLEEEEIICYNENDFNSYPIEKVEYVVLRSNIENGKMLLIDNIRKHILGTGFDELESLELADTFNPSAFTKGQ